MTFPKRPITITKVDGPNEAGRMTLRVRGEDADLVREYLSSKLAEGQFHRAVESLPAPPDHPDHTHLFYAFGELKDLMIWNVDLPLFIAAKKAGGRLDQK